MIYSNIYYKISIIRIKIILDLFMFSPFYNLFTTRKDIFIIKIKNYNKSFLLFYILQNSNNKQQFLQINLYN